MLDFIFFEWKLKSFFTSFNEYLFLALLLAIGLLSVYSAAKAFETAMEAECWFDVDFFFHFIRSAICIDRAGKVRIAWDIFPYFLIIFTVQFVLFKCFGSVHYSAWNAKFPQGIPWLPFAASITGIFFGWGFPEYWRRLLSRVDWFDMRGKILGQWWCTTAFHFSWWIAAWHCLPCGVF